MFEGLLSGLGALADVTVLIMIPVGVVLGIAIGAVPGLSATVGMALFLPFAFSLDPLTGLVMLLGIYNGACYSAAIPAVLVNTPGSPTSAATTLDGYPMAMNGRAGEALTLSLISSVIGGVVGGVLLILFAPLLARYASQFGSAEYFAIAVLALTMIATIGGKGARLKAVLSAAIGTVVVLIGFDPFSAEPRMTFGNEQMLGGIQLIPLLVGLFGIAESLKQMERLMLKPHTKAAVGSFSPGNRWFRKYRKTLLGSTAVGFGSGLLPGVGGDIGGYLAYNEVMRVSREKDTFGKGNPQGVVAAETANNASNMGSLVSTFSLGIPGNTQAAVLLGALLIAGIQPGPGLFSSSADLVYGSFIAMLIAYVCLLAFGLVGIRGWVRLIQVPPHFLWPGVLLFSILGAYAVRNSLFDVLVAISMGVLGYFMSKVGLPVPPLLIAVIVIPMAEENLRRLLILNGGDFSWILSPVTLVILTLAVVIVLWPAVTPLVSKVMSHDNEEAAPRGR